MSLGNTFILKQEQREQTAVEVYSSIEVYVESQCYDLTGITDIVGYHTQLEWCNDGYRIFRKDKLRGWGGGVDLYVRDQHECMKFYLSSSKLKKGPFWQVGNQANVVGGLPAWVYKILLKKFQHKEVYKMQKHRQVTQEYSGADKSCIDIFRKANLKLNLARDMKTNKKSM